MYLAGISVRRVEDMTIGGTRMSPSRVSNLNKTICAKIETWWSRRIEGEHPYLYQDGIVMKRSWAGKVRNGRIHCCRLSTTCLNLLADRGRAIHFGTHWFFDSIRRIGPNVFLAPFVEEALPKEWLDGSVPVHFDFGDNSGSDDPFRIVSAVLWCLIPKRVDGYAVVVAVQKGALISAHRKGRCQPCMKVGGRSFRGLRF